MHYIVYATMIFLNFAAMKLPNTPRPSRFLAPWALLLGLLLVSGTAAQAQLMLQLDLGLGLPSANRSNLYRFGFGGDFRVAYRFQKPFTLAVASGYYVNRLDDGNTDGSFRFVPLVAQAEYYFATKFIRPYVGAEIGGYFALEERGRNVLKNTSDLGGGLYAGMFMIVSPSLGLDMRLQYRHFLTGNIGGGQGYAALLVGVVVPVTNASREHSYDY